MMPVHQYAIMETALRHAEGRSIEAHRGEVARLWADFSRVAAANPDAWPRSEMQAEMRMHLDVTLQEATARLNGDFAADIAAYDEVHDHILAFADLLSNGIIQQFPDRFAG